VSNGVRDLITHIKDEVVSVGDEVAPLWRNGVASPRMGLDRMGLESLLNGFEKKGDVSFKNPPQMKLLQVVGLGG
jgi:hypothetical protein